LAQERGSDVGREQVDAETTLSPCERADTDMHSACCHLAYFDFER